MNKKLLWIPIGIVVFGFVLHSIVKGCNDEEPGGDFKAKVPKTEFTDADSSFKALKLYIDFSGSMKGYLNFSGFPKGKDVKSQLRSTVGTFLNNVGKYYQDVNILCGENKADKNPDEFMDYIQEEYRFSKGSTELVEMMETCYKNANDSTAVAFVSDMVLSYGQKKIESQNDKYYNKHQLDALQTAFNKYMTKLLKVKHLDVVLLQYYSDFNGNYYCNCTENILEGTAYKDSLMKDRPYYIMLIGNKTILKSILAKDCLKDPANIYASFGMEDVDMTDASFDIEQDVNTDFWTKGTATDEMGTFWTSSDLGDEKTTFKVTCSNFKIPTYLNKDILEGYDQNGICSVKIDDYIDENRTIKFKVTTKKFKELEKKSQIDICIKSLKNNWIKKASVDDDDDVNKPLKKLETKTWGLHAIIDAINLAYYGKTVPDYEIIGHFSFSLIKK